MTETFGTLFLVVIVVVLFIIATQKDNPSW